MFSGSNCFGPVPELCLHHVASLYVRGAHSGLKKKSPEVENIIEETKRVSKTWSIDSEVDKHTETAFILHILLVSVNQNRSAGLHTD